MSSVREFEFLTVARVVLRMEDMKLAERFKLARQAADLTQQQVADACGISMQAVSHWETGRSLEIEAPHLFKVADVLGVSARWLSSEECPRDKTDVERDIDRLPPDKRQLVLDLIKTLAK